MPTSYILFGAEKISRYVGATVVNRPITLKTLVDYLCPALPRKIDRTNLMLTRTPTTNNNAKPNNTISCEGNGGCASDQSHSGPTLLAWSHTAIPGG